MSVCASNQGSLPREIASIELVVSLAIAHESSDHVRSNTERPSAFQPTEPSRFSFASRSRPALEIDPKNATLDHLEIDVTPAHIRMIENYVSPQVATDHRERLI
jgi:hypothetical protein